MLRGPVHREIGWRTQNGVINRVGLATVIVTIPTAGWVRSNVILPAGGPTNNASIVRQNPLVIVRERAGGGVEHGQRRRGSDCQSPLQDPRCCLRRHTASAAKPATARPNVPGSGMASNP